LKHARLAYLEWAHARHPAARINLAVSGVSDAPAGLLGDAPDVADRRALARWVEAVAAHLGLPEAEVAPSIGTSHAIWQACAATIEPGDVVAVEAPAYESIVAVPLGFGARVVRFERPVAQGFAVDPDRVDRALAQGAKLVVVTDLHNPSAAALAEDVLREVAERAARRGAYVLVDEVYRAIDPARRPVTTRLVHPAVLAISSLTKVFGLGWARAGWLAGPPEIVARVRASNQHVAGMMPVPSAAWGLRALERLEVLRARTNAVVSGKRERVEAWIASHGDVSWTAPPPSLFGLVRVRGLEGSLAFANRLHDRTGVLVTPGSFFDLDDHLRISWGEPPEKLEEGLATLGRALDEWKDHR
jgi:hypothetical protein